jgi:digeranylgeranylglycerophospholipid reductase
MAKNEILGFSRKRFDQHLLNKALSEGANLVEEKVISLQKQDESWRVITQKETYEVKTLVGADGVNSLTRRNIVGPLDKTDLGACFGYIFQGAQEKNVTIKFLAQLEGYIWVIPRGDNTCIGGGTAKVSNFRELKNQVNLFIKTWYSGLVKVSEWAALIPNAKKLRTLLLQVAGPNWVLIGDAAGHVSPISGSGIVYALMDGELAAKAIAEGHVEQFNKMWVEVYGKQLLLETRLRGLIYHRPMLELYCMYLKLHSYIPFS